MKRSTDQAGFFPLVYGQISFSRSAQLSPTIVFRNLKGSSSFSSYFHHPYRSFNMLFYKVRDNTQRKQIWKMDPVFRPLSIECEMVHGLVITILFCSPTPFNCPIPLTLCSLHCFSSDRIVYFARLRGYTWSVGWCHASFRDQQDLKFRYGKIYIVSPYLFFSPCFPIFSLFSTIWFP